MSKYLASKGFEIRQFDNLLYDLPPENDFEFIQGDINNPLHVDKAMDGVDHVIHLAAIANDPATDLDPRISLQINFESIRLLIYSANKHGIKRFLFSSSCSVYGAKGEEISDETSELKPVTFYGKLKVDVEKELLDGSHIKFTPIIFRNATAFGYSPRLRLDLAINILTLKALKEGKYTIFGGEQWRPFVHIKDISQAFYLGLTAPEKKVSGEIFNVGSTDLNFKMKSIVPIFEKLIPSANPLINEAKADLRSYRVDFSKIKNKLGFEYKYSIEDGISEIEKIVKDGKLNDWKENTQYYCVNHLKKFAEKKFPEITFGKRAYPLLNGENS